MFVGLLPESASLNSSPKKLSDTRDDYDVFTILGSSKHGHDSEGASLNPSPPKSSDTPDDSDLFAILGSSKHGHDSEGASLNPSPKKTRVALMGGKTTSQSGAVPSSGSTGCFQPASSIARPANRLLNRVVSSNSGSDLFGPSTQTSTLTPRKALARQLSSDFPPIPVNHEVINTSNLVSLIPAGNAIKKTYGGVRTFKQDESELKVLLPLSTPAPPRSSKRLSATPAGSSRFMGSLKRFQSRETYSELRKKWGVDEDDEPLEAQADLQTIIHQRASGSSKRFTDELLYLIEGLVTRADPPDISTKRSSAVLLIQKLKEQRFLEELRSNGLIERFYNSIREAGAGDGDPILDHALLIFISVLCCQDQKFIEPVLRIIPKGSTEVFSMQSDCLQLLGSVAGRDYSQATLKERGNARRRSSLVSQIREVVEESVLRKHFSGVSSPGLLALFSLSRIAMFVPRPGLLPQRSIVHCSAFASVIECLKVYGDKLGHQFDDFVSHHEDFSIADGQDILKHAGYCMDVIEACTVCEEDALNSINLCRQSLSSVFGSLISRCHSLARHDRSEISMSALDILIGCLRTMVNVTNYNPTWASELSTPSVLQALCGLFGICREGFNHHRSTQNSDPRLDPLSIVNQPHHTSLPSLDHRVNDVVFDLLCVDLGLLANLVEQSTEATDMLRETQWVQESDLPAALTRKNRKGHPNRIGGFEELIKLYIDPPCEKLDEKKFIRGSISVLINLSLLNGYDDQLSDLDDAYQSLNELEIIQSFNRILKQVESDSGHRQEEHGQEGHERKDSREANGQSLDADGELESGKLLTKNEIIKSFMTDLKLHSGSASFSLAQPDRNPTLNPPSTAGAHAIERNPNGGEHFQILSSCWNRLRVELI
ncbi:hypothetical protein PCANC_12936 [Puccinia coronata f. sp. avenae]|uniref:Wings apart-like protein C-terminal domain-containing protein n=1 Tax=Puccinia coronata f. sp. avenae TaxID=200324 RepID=A0A2N5UN85_9BASI|nr:hypothetical protein PCANC_19133 [Puccinia coronata f. sp. avenae]PLW39231.1 hypothetical protein PCANC_12936 [Puccinia coronata f. sp. avenae]